MEKKISKKLLASLLLNLVMFFTICGIGYYKRNSIKTKILKLFPERNEQKIEKLAKDMNKSIFEPINASYENNQSEKRIKIAFIGNSLTLHGVAENIGWNRECGMAASSLDNDYVHKTLRKIANEKNVSIDYVLINTADFERNFDTFENNRFEKIFDFKPEYIIFQFGENILENELEENYDIFIEKYKSLINCFGEESIKIVCLPFWHSAKKNQAITKVALETKSFLVDLSHLGNGLANENYASSEFNYKHPGVRIHPGDFGMENISDNIFSVFNVILQ